VAPVITAGDAAPKPALGGIKVKLTLKVKDANSDLFKGKDAVVSLLLDLTPLGGAKDAASSHRLACKWVAGNWFRGWRPRTKQWRPLGLGHAGAEGAHCVAGPPRLTGSPGIHLGAPPTARIQANPVLGERRQPSTATGSPFRSIL